MANKTLIANPVTHVKANGKFLWYCVNVLTEQVDITVIHKSSVVDFVLRSSVQPE